MSQNRLKQTSNRAAPRSAWEPGQSGNPGGRPRVVADVRALAQLEGPASIAALARVRDNPKSPPAAVVSASLALLDRGFGRPQQSVHMRRITSLQDLTDEELQALLTSAPVDE
jgi:hypothetical protein